MSKVLAVLDEILYKYEGIKPQNMAKGGVPQLVQPGPTATSKVKKILEDLPKGSTINRLELIKKTNVDPSLLTKLIKQYPEKKFNVVRQSSGRPGVIKKGTTPKLEKIAQKVYGKPFEELDVAARGRIRLGIVTAETESAYAKEKTNKRFDKESQYRYGKDYKDLNPSTQQLIREGRTQTVGGVSSTIWKPREKLKKYVEAFKKRKGRPPYLFELTSDKGAGFNFTMVKKAVDEGVINLGKSGYANPWQESRMKLVNDDLLKLSKNKKILAAFNAADSKELVKLTKDILNIKDASVAEGRIAQLGAVFSGDRYAPNIKKNPILERRVSDVVEGLEMNRRERRRLADLKIGKSVGEKTTLAAPRQYATRAYPEKWLYDIDEPAGVLSSVKNKTAPYGVFAQVIDRDVNRKAKKSYDSIKSKQERVVQEAIKSGDKAQINKAVKNFNNTALKYEKIFAKNTKPGKEKIKLLKISLNKPENTIERFDKLPEGYQNAFKKNYQARGYSFKVPKDLKTAYEIAKDIKNPQIAAMMGKRALAGEARLYSFPANLENPKFLAKEALEGSKMVGRGISKALPYAFGPTGIIGLNAALGVDPKSSLDRAGIAAEAAFAPALVKGTISATDKIKNPLLRKVAERGSLALMSPAMALRAARIASPIGLASLAAEGLYHAGKKEMARREKMSPQELEDFHLERQSRGWSRMGQADGGIVSLSKK